MHTHAFSTFVISWLLAGSLALPSAATAQARHPDSMDEAAVDTSSPLEPAPAVEPRIAGPVAELSVGGALLTATPFIAGLVILAADDSPFLGCEDWFSGESDPQCEAESRAERRQADRAGLSVGIPLGLISTLLIVHGAYRTRRALQARRRLRLHGVDVQAGRQSAGLQLDFSF